MLTKDTDKKLFLLDAFALIYRAYFAFSNNPRINSKGFNTSAIFGFTNTLLEILNKEKPSHIAVVFDMEGPTQRHVEFESYKANREEMPEDLRDSIPIIRQLIKGFNIEIMGIEGYEADDLIGTLAMKAEKAGFTTYMMTPDKDYGQLVDANTFIYKPARLGNGAEILGPEEICKKWEIRNVSELIDILGLMGDKVDNIPGIPGVGEKTAIQLIKDFGSIENLLQNTDKLKGKLKEKVELNKDLAIQSKRLAKIILDCPLELNEKQLTIREYNKPALGEIFRELEFRRIAEQVLGEEAGAVGAEKPSQQQKAQAANGQVDLFSSSDTVEVEEAPQEAVTNFKNIDEVAHDYELLDSDAKIENLIERLRQCAEYSFDTETTSLCTLDAELVGLSISLKAAEAYYLAIPPQRELAQALVERFRPILEDPAKTMIGQNIKYDYEVLLNYNVQIQNK